MNQSLSVKLRDLATRPLPGPPKGGRRKECERNFAAHLDELRHQLDKRIREAGGLLADAFDVGLMPGCAIEVSTALCDMNARDSRSLSHWFIFACLWFCHYQRKGLLPDIEHPFPVPEDEEQVPPHRRIPKPVVLPLEAIRQQHEDLQTLLLAFADLIEAYDIAEFGETPYAVKTGSTLRCVQADGHLAAAVHTLGTLLSEHETQLPRRSVGKTISVAQQDCGDVKTFAIRDCIDAMPLLDLTEKNKLSRVLSKTSQR